MAGFSAGVEVGHGLTVSSSPLVDDNWELRFPQSVRTFAKMRREDSQIETVLSAISLPIRRSQWRIDPNGAPDEIVERVAGDLRLPILGGDAHVPVGRSRGRVSWGDHLQKVMWAMQFGHMFFEQIYGTDERGQEHLVKLAPRLPGSIKKINVAHDGGLESIEQWPVVGNSLGRVGDPVVIPVGRLVAYVHEPLDTTWEGRSVLRPAFKHWKLRDLLLRFEVNAVERNSMGIPVYQGSEFAADSQEDLRFGQKIATEIRSGQSSGAAIPAGAKLSLMGVSGQLLSPREAIVYHDSMMAKSVLAHFLNLEDGGSYALADTQADLFIQSLQTKAEWIADTATQHIIEDLVDVAFPEYAGTCPRMVFDPIASRKEITAEALALLVNAGVIFTDRELEEDVRSRFAMPAKEKKEVVSESAD